MTTNKINLVLLIDNQSTVSNHLISMIEADNAQVVLQANDYIEAMHIMENYKPDFILIDVSLNGQLKSNILKEMCNERKDAKAILITNLSNKKYIDFCETMGVNYFLDYPDFGVVPGIVYDSQLN
ncbi:response regulator transcription factor [Ferruginibacter albus]|uniref:response regulator transcription factor n=1 Tax=Ferruginibacter albus TaxID=2875540 RepID=UPI001CC61DCB|nr:response regulator [Ferruginibacter albus]UAY52195.1 response regulator [Ferruginibacter albus]